jgi:hypothetical protein
MRKGTVSFEHAHYAAKKISSNRKTSGVVQVRRLGPGQNDFGVFVIDGAKHRQGPAGVLVSQYRRGQQS